MSPLIAGITTDLCGTDTTDLPALVRALGGNVSAAARAVGVPRSTLRGWLAGRTPKRANRAITAAARGALTVIHRPGHYAAAYNGTKTLRISGTITKSRDSRSRTINVGQYIPQSLMKRILTTWAGAKDNTADTLLNNAIDHYYTDLDFTTIDRVWFE